MLPVSTITTNSGNGDVEFLELPNFGVTKTIPSWCIKQLEEAVKDFIRTSHLPQGVDPDGFYYQTLEAIAQMTCLGGSGDFWMMTSDHQVLGYLLARVVKDVDNRFCYWISQAWVKKSHRGNPIVLDCWQKIKERAKALFCVHVVLVTSRSAAAYKRFLKVHDYASILKCGLREET